MFYSTMSEERIPPSKLAKLNPHPRDEFITFEEGPHIYTVHGDSSFTSSTTFVHYHFDHFDADKIIDNMQYKIENTPDYKYYKMTRQEIKDLWAKNGDTASKKGSKIHADIENYYNDEPVENDSVEYKYFMNFVKDFPELKPYRTEWMVYYEELKISGSIDMVYENPDGTLQIYDWKRSKEISYESYKDKCAKTECIRHLPDCNYWHYSLQLNIYKTILEHKYGKKVSALYLVRLHPDNHNENYDRIEVADLSKEVEMLFLERKKELEAQSI